MTARKYGNSVKPATKVSDVSGVRLPWSPGERRPVVLVENLDGSWSVYFVYKKNGRAVRGGPIPATDVEVTLWLRYREAVAALKALHASVGGDQFNLDILIDELISLSTLPRGQNKSRVVAFSLPDSADDLPIDDEIEDEVVEIAEETE